MTRLMITFAAAGAALGGFAVLPAPAAAQNAGGQAEVVVYGDDPCPRSTDSTIVVCVHRPEQERYRLPKNQQLQGTRQQREAWSNRAQAVMNSGRTGINSCSAVGPGGYTGCLTQQIQQTRQENQEARDQSAPPQQ
jgi:hypothetical protein